MKPIGMTMLVAALAAPTPGAAQTVARDLIPMEHETMTDITRKADLKTVAGPTDWFTGKVTITGQFQRENPSRVGGAIVHFEPGARTAWHKHPLGQTLIVTEGVGWTQVEDGAIHEFQAGDQLWCPADRKHWHGATSTTAMTHIAIQESLNGTPVTWLEHVTDEQYLAGPAKR